MSANEIPLKLYRKKEELDYFEEKFEIPNNPNKEAKERCLVFNGDTSLESYIDAIETVYALSARYELDADENDVQEMFHLLERSLGGDIRDMMREFMADVGGMFTKDAYDDVVHSISEEVMGPNAFERQMEYLKTTRVPADMPIRVYIRRIKRINSKVGYLARHAEPLTEKQLIREILLAPGVLPLGMKQEFIRARGRECNNISQALEILEASEETHHLGKTNKRKNNNNNERDNKRRRNNQSERNDNGNKQKKNMCKLDGHNHEWKDCPNNPRSEKFSGTSFRDLRKKNNRNNERHYLNISPNTSRYERFTVKLIIDGKKVKNARKTWRGNPLSETIGINYSNGKAEDGDDLDERQYFSAVHLQRLDSEKRKFEFKNQKGAILILSPVTVKNFSLPVNYEALASVSMHNTSGAVNYFDDDSDDDEKKLDALSDY